MADDILGEIARMLVEVVGEDFLQDVEIGMDTAFNEELALESIEFVALAQRVRDRYGDGTDLAAFVADLDLDRLTNLTVGDLVRHLGPRVRPAGV
ncbi:MULTISPECIES: acyl carrier protein [Actinomadura]|uniref:Acyl carrier protein n=1 Tax=Actinomadura yumaensis TaxID=111807 RepID=A0ABW2CVJ5_9ACTN|nr:acyl carrier protein [Actinomadura sp. J1-007]MWK37628.1 acyl carrier protein [Actinomadura sp. J1-007]